MFRKEVLFVFVFVFVFVFLNFEIRHRLVYCL